MWTALVVIFWVLLFFYVSTFITVLILTMMEYDEKDHYDGAYLNRRTKLRRLDYFMPTHFLAKYIMEELE